MDELKLAQILYKIQVDWRHSDSKETIWEQMRPSVREAFLVHARYIIAEMEKGE